jgi:hypothetical protein
LTHWNSTACPKLIGLGDLPRQPQEIGDADDLEDEVQHRKQVEQAHQPDADEDDHQREAEAHAERMRHGAAQAEIGARRHQHHIVRPRRDRRDEGKGGKRGEGGLLHAAQYNGDALATGCKFGRRCDKFCNLWLDWIR